MMLVTLFISNKTNIPLKQHDFLASPKVGKHWNANAHFNNQRVTQWEGFKR